MQLEHQFSVPAPIDEVFSAVLDPQRVAPCMPGASLKSVDGKQFRGSVKVKLGPVSLLYSGSGEFTETDEAAHRAVITASGKDARGNGTASATVVLQLAADGESTTGTVTTDLNVTGKPAQFGRGMISDVGGKLLSSFADCLSDKLGSTPAPDQPAPDQPASGQSAPDPSAPEPVTTAPAGATAMRASGGDAHQAEAIDLLSYAGTPVLKRVAPVLGGALLLGLAGLLATRRRRRRSRRAVPPFE